MKASNPNLTSTRIVDKNGKTTTVYKKNNTAQRPVNIPNIHALIDSYVDKGAAMSAIFGGTNVFETGRKNTDYLANSAPRILEAIAEQCKSDPVLKKAWLAKLNYVTMHTEPHRKYAEEMSANFIRQYQSMVKLFPVVAPIHEVIEAAEETSKSTSLIQKSSFDSLYSVAKVMFNSPKEEVQTILLLNPYVKESPNDFRSEIPKLSHRLDDIIRIVPELSRRGKVPFSFVKELIDAPSSSLIDGAL